MCARRAGSWEPRSNECRGQPAVRRRAQVSGTAACLLPIGSLLHSLVLLAE